MPSKIEIIIEAVNKAQAALTESQRQVAALNKENTASVGVMGRVKAVVSENKAMFAGMAAVIAAVPAAMVGLTRSAINTADDLGDMSQRVGVSVERLSALRLAGAQSGIGMGELEMGFKTLAGAIQRTSDPASEASHAFRVLNVNVRNSAGELKSNEQLLLEIADGFTRLNDGAGKSALAVQLFGRSGQQLIPLLNQGAAGLDALQARAKELGIEISSKTSRASDEFNDKLAELTLSLKAVGLRVAEDLLPYLIKFVDYVLAHHEAVKTAFLGIATAVTALTVAMVGLKMARVIGSLAGALAGVGSVKTVEEFGRAVGTLIGRAGLAVERFKALSTAVGSAIGSASLANILRFTGWIGVATTAIYAGVKAWEAWKAKRDAALSETQLDDTTERFRPKVDERLRRAVGEGLISDEEVAEWEAKLAKAREKFTRIIPAPTGAWAPPTSEITSDYEQERRVTNEMFNRLAQLRARTSEAKAKVQQVASDSLTEETKAKIRVAQHEIAIARKQVELSEIWSKAAMPGSTVPVDETIAEQRRVLTEIFEDRRTFIETEFAEQSRRLRETAEKDVMIAAIKDSVEKERQLKLKIVNEETSLEIDKQKKLSELTTEHRQQTLELDRTLATDQLDVQKRATQTRLTIAQLTNRELLAVELEFQLRVAELRESQRNVTEGQGRLSEAQIEAIARYEKERKTILLKTAAQERELSLVFALGDAQKTLAATDPNLGAAERQERLNHLVRQENTLLYEQIRLNQAAISSSVLHEDERTERQLRNIELQQRIIQNNRLVNTQAPTDLPRFQSDLGFQNKLNPAGLKTGSRELIAPFAALDDYLSGTLQTTFGGLRDSISGLITGTREWADVWRQVGISMIDQVVQLVLEYTAFYAVRRTLDTLFHTQARTNIVATAAAGQAAQATATTTAVASGATVAAAQAPAAAASSIWSWGSSATVGMVLALAAIGAIIGALAFREGGIVGEQSAAAPAGLRPAALRPGRIHGPGTGTSDSILASAPAGSAIINAAAVARYPQLIDALTTAKASTASPGHSATAGDRVRPIRVSAGEVYLPPQTVAAVGVDFIRQINTLRIERFEEFRTRKFALGGLVDDDDERRKSASGLAPRSPARRFERGGILEPSLAAVPSAIAVLRPGRIHGPGTGTSDSILASAPAGSAIINAAAVARYPRIIDALTAPRLPIGSAPAGTMPIRVSHSEAFLAPAVVAAVGSSFITRLNQMQVDASVLRFDHITAPRFAAGGVLGGDGGAAMDASAMPDQGIFQNISAQLSSQPNISVQPAAAQVHVGVLNSLTQTREFLESHSGQKLIFDIVNRRKLDLGIG